MVGFGRSSYIPGGSMRGILQIVVLCGSVSAGSSVAQISLDPALRIEKILDGSLASPTGMAFIGDDDLLVLEKNTGRVRRVLGGVLQSGNVLDLAVNNQSERGLLGIALDPDFVNNRHVYLYVTVSSTGSDTGSGSPLGNRVYRYYWNGSALVGQQTVLALDSTSNRHNGGVLAFGADDRLYVLIGDLERDGQLRNDPEGPPPDDVGVVFRVDREGRGLPDNPLHDATDASNPLNRYFAYGIRNGFGLAFDPVTGHLWDTENGSDDFDEINHVVPGFNSGWDLVMGPIASSGTTLGDLVHFPGAVYADPQLSWLDPPVLTAAEFVDSRVMGCESEHDLLIGAHSCRVVYRMDLNATRTELQFDAEALQDRVVHNLSDRCGEEQASITLATNMERVTDIENAPDGTVYVLAIDGDLFRISPLPGAVTDADGDMVDDACDCAAGDPGAFAMPYEVPLLRVSNHGPTFGWDAQQAQSGSETSYRVVTGSIDSLRMDGGFASACTLAAGLDSPSHEDVRADPAPGQARYYLVQATNGCGAGSFGDAGVTPDPRDALDATPPGGCAP